MTSGRMEVESIPPKRIPKNIALVSLVSVYVGNWCYLCGTVERVEKGETLESANIHAVFMHVDEKVVE